MLMNRLSLWRCRFAARKATVRAMAAQRLKATAGFMLTEVLATVIILGLVTSGVAMAVTVGTQQFTQSMAASESRMLFSTLQQDMKNDLSYTSTLFSEETPSGDEVVAVTGYKSLHHGDKNVNLYLKALDEDGTVVEPAVGSGDLTYSGQLALCSMDGKVINRLLGKAAYNYGLTARVKSLTYDPKTKLFEVNLAIDSADGVLIDETFSVKALNHVEFNQ